jgi:hypothetical protein
LFSNATCSATGGPADEEDTHLAFGVADGVYLWRWEGIDAGMYSRRLMGLASESFAENEVGVVHIQESSGPIA